MSTSTSESISTSTSTSNSDSSNHQGSLVDPSGFKPSHQNPGEQHLSGSMDSSEFINSNQSNKESNFTSENEHNHNQVTQHGEKHSDQQNDKSLPNTGEDETNRGGLVSLVLTMLAGLGLIRRSKKDKNKDRKNNED
ncbi:LPXTG cell wall anchor domain-containing protein [Staphylococcus capitis]|nr:hypothetical protein BU630_01555 [Staphylococcus capitis]PTG98553.1 hypothetical protein BU625_05745 [Staphylococcus capitis]PTH10919.1 hypothetical protein BU618_03440 [Staphylococcus capitis]PTH39672.1 hypothetical protein BU619_07685 [Staphylococcus capitis]